MEEQPVGRTIDLKFPYKFEVFQFGGAAQNPQSQLNRQNETLLLFKNFNKIHFYSRANKHEFIRRVTSVQRFILSRIYLFCCPLLSKCTVASPEKGG